MIFQSTLSFLVAYLMLLTYAAWRAPRRTPISTSGFSNDLHSFSILIPAHNEAKLLPRLLSNLATLDYPRSHFKIHVIADNCTDKTADLARQSGVIVHERFNPDQRGKGFALQWLLDQLWQSHQVQDAVVILDADTIVSPNFLRVMNTRLSQGERVIQAYYAVQNPEGSFSAGLRYAALAMLHYLRPQGRMVLGGSVGLKGNGMVFAADVMEKHTWSDSVTEDIELHMMLLLSGERVTFSPDAVIQAEMPNKLADARSQNARWEQGRLQMAKKYVPKLLKAFIDNLRHPKRAFVFGDAIMEHVIPPFSILASLSGISFLASLFWWRSERNQSRKTGLSARNSPRGAAKLSKLNLVFSFGTILGQACYLLAGLKMVNAPKSVYRVFVYAPGYVIWKIWHYLRILFGFENQMWVRTTRNEG